MTDRLTRLRKFLQDDPTDTFTRYAIALEQAKLGDDAATIQAFEDVLANDPSYAPAYHQLGLFFAARHRKADARAALERGIEAARSVGDAHAVNEMQESLDELTP